MKNIVFVDGNIIAQSGEHLAKELIAFADEEWRQIEEKRMPGDCILTKEEKKLSSFKIYCAAKDVVAYEKNSLSALLSPKDIENIYRQEIQLLEKLMEQPVSSDLVEILNRQIFIGVVGTMELFLEDFMFSMVMGTEKYFKRYCDFSSKKFKLKEIANKNWSLQNVVIKSIREIIYHKIDEKEDNRVSKMYKNVLSVDFNPTERLKKLIKTRHELVHRNGLSGEIGFIKIEKETIKDLITEVNTLVDNIVETRQYEIKNWLPYPKKLKSKI